jgi:hypothetical protein
MNTAVSVRVWVALCRLNNFKAARMRGTVAALLVCEGHCANETEARRYMRAMYS